MSPPPAPAQPPPPLPDVVQAASGGSTAAAEAALAAWFVGPSLLEALDAVSAPSVEAATAGPLRLCVSDVYKSPLQGLVAAGRIESGFLSTGPPSAGGGGPTKVRSIPTAGTAPPSSAIKSIILNGEVTTLAVAGDNVDVGLGGGMGEEAVAPGSVLCWPSHPLPLVSRFKARVVLFPVVGYTGGRASTACSDGNVIMPGQQFTLHTHATETPCNVTRLLRTLTRDGHTGAIKPRLLTTGGDAAGGEGSSPVAVVRIRLARPIPLTTFQEHRRLGRFVLRYAGRTVAAGLVLKLNLEL